MTQHARVCGRPNGMAVGAVQPRTVARQHAQVDGSAQADRTDGRWQRAGVQLLEERAARPHLRATAAPGQPGDPRPAVRCAREDRCVHRFVAALEQVAAQCESPHRVGDHGDPLLTRALPQRLRCQRDFMGVVDVAAIPVAEREAAHRRRIPAGFDEEVAAGTQHARRVAPSGNEQDGRAALRHQLILPCCDVSISSVCPDLNRNASMLDMRNSRAGWSRTSRP